MRVLIKAIKDKLPLFIRENISRYLNRPIVNLYGTNHNKTALLSYIVHPFRKDSFQHTNYFEAQSWAKVLSELGYNIDVLNFDSAKQIEFSKYDLICGFGDVFQRYFEAGIAKKLQTIYYGTGMHVCYQNHASLYRIRDVYNKKGIWLGKSARFVEKTWTHQTTLVDGIIALGNSVCAESYRKYFDGHVFSVPAPFYATKDANEIIKQRKQTADKHFLWFGSSGLIHKGLDLLLDFFASRPELTLHVCGSVENEPDFVSTYNEELFNTTNIKAHGFVDINSEGFSEILKSCDFVIFPSCSEGGAPSVLTVIGYCFCMVLSCAWWCNGMAYG